MGWIKKLGWALTIIGGVSSFNYETSSDEFVAAVIMTIMGGVLLWIPEKRVESNLNKEK